MRCMRWLGIGIALTVLAGVASAAAWASTPDWPTWGSDPGADHYAGGDSAISSAQIARLREAWQIDLCQAPQLGTNGSAPVVAAGVAYFSTCDSVEAANVATGTVLWSVPLSPYTSPTLSGTTLFVGTTNGAVVALSADTGATLWSTSLADQYPSNPTIDGSSVIVSDGPSVYELSSTTGAILWTYTSPTTPIVDGLLLCNQSNYRDISAAALYDGDLYFVSQYFIFELDGAGQLVWYTTVNAEDGYNSYVGSGFSNPITEDGVVYGAALAGDGGSQLEALSASSGAIVWQQDNAWSGGDMALANGVLFDTNGYSVEAFDASSGASDWTGGGGGSSGVTVAGDVVFYNWGALDVANGNSVWSNPFGCATPITVYGSNVMCAPGQADNAFLVDFDIPSPPTCAVTSIRRAGQNGFAGAYDQEDVAVQSAVGLASIQNINIDNGTVQVPSFNPGATSLVVTATKAVEGVLTHWSFDATDTAGQTTSCG